MLATNAMASAMTQSDSHRAGDVRFHMTDNMPPRIELCPPESPQSNEQTRASRATILAARARLLISNFNAGKMVVLRGIAQAPERRPSCLPPPELSLPIDDVLAEITARTAESGVLVLQAPPGAGKTTRVPPALLDSGVPGKIVVLEPRRLAARLAARRVAAERGEAVGGTVGYEVRFDRSISASTRIEFVTEGILTRRLMADPELRGVGAVVLDEFHERHLQGDLALALLARLRASSRPELKLVVMSATLDALPVADYLGAPVVSSLGRQFEVVVDAPDRGRQPSARIAGRDRRSASSCDRAPRAMCWCFFRERPRSGARWSARLLLPTRPSCSSCALHGDLSPDAQDAALQPAGCQKVIFSTNVAETSVTIEGVEAVIDSGLARIAKYDPWSGRPSLEVAKISRASAAQRAGRAGRLGPGRAVRLYTKGDHDARPEHESPEILRADLAETVLALRDAGVNVADMRWLDAPPRPAIDGAEQLLFRLGALDGQGAVTDVGRKMLRFAAPPRFSKIIVEAASRGAAYEGCVAAAMLAEGRDIYARSWDAQKPVETEDESSDLTVRLAAFEDATRGGFDRQRVEAARAFGRGGPGGEESERAVRPPRARRGRGAAIPTRSFVARCSRRSPIAWRAAGNRRATKRVSGPTVSSSCAPVEPRSSPNRAWSEPRRGWSRSRPAIGAVRSSRAGDRFLPRNGARGSGWRARSSRSGSSICSRDRSKRRWK